MRARDHDGLGREVGDAARHLAVGVDGRLDVALAAASNPGNDQRRGCVQHKQQEWT